MPKYAFKNPKFIKTATMSKDYPKFSREIFPEVAVAGRSNVGKSSLMNHLFQRKGLVHTSSKPGKTQALNFFLVDDKLIVVDLPGYGFAQVPVSVRKQWGPMVQNYLEKRKNLKLMLFLLDIRRLPNDDDKQLLEWIAHNEIATILVLTKSDKVNQRDRKKNTEKILEAFDAENLHYIHYSVKKDKCRDVLIGMINEALSDEG